MKNIFKKTELLPLGLLALGAMSFSACDLRDKGGELINQATNEVAKGAESCENYNTQSQADAENEVIRDNNLDYKFNLYWLGREAKMDVWEDKGIDDHFSVALKPAVISALDANQQVTSLDECEQSPSAAENCIPRLKNVVEMIVDARQSIAARGVNLSEGKDMTFKCAQEYSEKKLAELQIIADQ